jgi:hypothetical protein
MNQTNFDNANLFIHIMYIYIIDISFKTIFIYKQCTKHKTSIMEQEKYILFVYFYSQLELHCNSTNINFIVFGLARSGLELTIYRTRGEHA